MKILNALNKRTFSAKGFAVASLAAAISLAGCSSDNPDSGSNTSTTSLSGIAVDGYLAGATVYIDFNNNGRKNAGEPTAITDKDGYFTTAKDGTEYCASDASTLEKIHCLKAGGLETGSVVRTFGGYDIFTGEPFTGSLSARITVGADGVVASQMVSPLTSMLVDIPDATDQQDILDFFGLSTSDLEADFLDSAGYDANAVNSAIKLHKIVTILAKAFTDAYDEFGDERSFPETPNAILYKALGENLAANNLLNSTTLGNAFDDAKASILALYTADENVSFPGNVSSGVRSTAISDALDIIGLVDDAIPSGTLFADAKSRVIGVETVVKKILDGDADTNDAIAEAGDISSGLYTAIDSALSGGDVDFIELTEVDYSALTPDYDDVAVVGGDSFAELANKQLYVNLSDDGKSGSAFFFFNSEQNATGGELNVCIEYDDGISGEPEFEETDGVLLKGTWLSLDDSRLILNLAGSLTVSLTDKGTTSNNLNRYSLSYGGDTLTWTSSDGLLDELQDSEIATQPTNDVTCETLLNETSSNNNQLR